MPKKNTSALNIASPVVEEKSTASKTASTSTKKKSASKATSVAVVSEPISAPVVVETTMDSMEADDQPDQLTIQFDGIIQTLGNFRQSITALQSQIRNLEKSVRRQMKTLTKEAVKHRNKGNRKPSGFAKPSLVSDELCIFMDRPLSSLIARTEVTQSLIKYITEKSLQFPDNKKIIIPDNTLKQLLNVTDNEEVNYFNLQRLMNRHFLKNTTTNSTNATQQSLPY